MTAEQVLQLHSEGFNRALTRQDYDALEGIYSEIYMLVRPDGSVLNKQQVLKDLREQLRIHTEQDRTVAQREGISIAFSTRCRLWPGGWRNPFGPLSEHDDCREGGGVKTLKQLSEALRPVIS
jgi:hypothetical protein